MKLDQYPHFGACDLCGRQLDLNDLLVCASCFIRVKNIVEGKVKDREFTKEDYCQVIEDLRAKKS